VNLLQFTAPNGEPVWIGGRWVTAVRHALQGEPGKTRIFIGGVVQNVLEQPVDVVAKLEAFNDQAAPSPESA